MIWLVDVRDAEPLEAALLYASHGWAVFPLVGKKPIFDGGFHVATTEPSKIREWWTDRPRANIGLPVPAGLLVLDVDADKSGFATLRALEEQHGPLPWTLRQSTGGGGEHWIFRAPAELELRQGAGMLGAGLDTRAAGRGYIVVAPSVHDRTKAAYSWHSLFEPTAAPAWLLDQLRVRAPARPAAPYTPPTNSRGLTQRQRYAHAVLRGEASAVAAAGEGSRNDALNRAWWRCAQFRDVLPRSEAEGELLAAGLASGLSEREIRKVLR
jgi:hypothetical protein